MSSAPDPATSGLPDRVSVRYWASARAAAGVTEEFVTRATPCTLAELVQHLVTAHDDNTRYRDVIGCCSVLVGDRPVSGTPATEVVVRPGDAVEFLPPFAGG